MLAARSREKICLLPSLDEMDLPRRACTAGRAVKVFVAAGEVKDIEIDVHTIGTRVEWEFSTESKSIEFGVYAKPLGSSKLSQEQMTEIVPCERKECHKQSEAGDFTVGEEGTLVLW